jgi:ribosomal protein S1
MLSISKMVGIVSCGIVLCVGLSDANAARSEDLSKGEIIKGEVLRVEAEHIVVKRATGKEVRLHIDQTTKMSDKKLEQGDSIVATVNEQNHALSIHSSDRRSDHTLESGKAVGFGN